MCCLQAKSLAMSSSVLSDDSLLAFVVQQYHPDCVMVSSCQPSTHQQVDPGVASQGTVSSMCLLYMEASPHVI